MISFSTKNFMFQNSAISAYSLSTNFSPIQRCLLSIIKESSDVYVYPIHNFKYSRLIKNLMPEIDDKIGKLKEPVKFRSIVHSIKAGNFNALDCDDPDLLYFALKGLKERALHINEFTMASIYWGIRQSHTKENIRIVNLFDKKGRLFEYAENAIKETAKLTSNLGLILYGKTILTPVELNSFFRQMRKEPKIQQLFFEVDDIEKIKPLEAFDQLDDKLKNEVRFLQCLSGSETIGTSIYRGSGINFLSRFTIREKERRMIPSWRMMQVFLNVKFGKKKSSQLYPTIDFPSLYEIFNEGETRRRSVLIPFHDVEYKEVDNLAIRQTYDLMFRDAVYLGLTSSLIPINHKKAFILLAKSVHKMRCPQRHTLNELALINSFVKYLFRMEQDHYIKQDENSFLKSLSNMTYFIGGMSSLENALLLTQTDEDRHRKYLDIYKNNDQATITELTEIFKKTIISTSNELIGLLLDKHFLADFVSLIVKERRTLEKLGISFKGLPTLAKIASQAIESRIPTIFIQTAKKCSLPIVLNNHLHPGKAQDSYAE